MDNGGDKVDIGKIATPADLIKLSLDQPVYVKLHNDREVTGRLIVCSSPASAYSGL